MEVHVKTLELVQVIELVGELDGSNAGAVQAQVLQLIGPASAVIMDMSRLTYMSSAGLRMLLSTYRTAASHKARVVLVGLNEEIRDTMSATGFLDFFTTHDTLDLGLAALSQ